MEPSDALAGGQDAGQQDGGQPAEGAEQFNPQEAFAQNQQSLEEIREALINHQQILQSEPWRPPPAPPAEPDYQPDLSALDPADPAYDEQLVRQVLDANKQMLKDELRQELDPIREQIRRDQRERQYELLAQEFPEVAEEGLADEIVQASRGLVEGHGDFPQELATHPLMIRLTYLAGRGVEAAKEEDEQGAQAPNAAQLVGGSGALPAGAGQPDLAAQILGGGDGERLGARVLDF